MRKFTDAEIWELIAQDTEVLEKARAWVVLKLFGEAVAELSHASEFSKARADFMEIQSLIHAVHGEWFESLERAEAMIVEAPKCEFGYGFRADAIRHLENARAAYGSLNEVVWRFPTSPLIHFNLACYAAAAGNHFAARKHLVQMFRIADQTEDVKFFQNLAVCDDDLNPLRHEIFRIKGFALKLNRLKKSNEKTRQN
jgi:tetratricopeptide (TPR) repeat protein